MLDIERTKEILKKILKIMIYLREEARKYQILVAGDYPEKYFFDKYTEHDFIGWKGPLWSKSNERGIIMKGFPFGEFITPLGIFCFRNTNSALAKDIDRFYTHCEAKFGIIKLRPRCGYFHHHETLFALSKDIEGNPLPLPSRNSGGCYDDDWFSPKSSRIPYEEAKNIWKTIKPQLINELFINLPDILHSTEKPILVQRNKNLSNSWDKTKKQIDYLLENQILGYEAHAKASLERIFQETDTLCHLALFKFFNTPIQASSDSEKLFTTLPPSRH